MPSHGEGTGRNVRAGDIAECALTGEGTGRNVRAGDIAECALTGEGTGRNVRAGDIADCARRGEGTGRNVRAGDIADCPLLLPLPSAGEGRGEGRPCESRRLLRIRPSTLNQPRRPWTRCRVLPASRKAADARSP